MQQLLTNHISLVQILYNRKISIDILSLHKNRVLLDFIHLVKQILIEFIVIIYMQYNKACGAIRYAISEGIWGMPLMPY